MLSSDDHNAENDLLDALAQVAKIETMPAKTGLEIVARHDAAAELLANPSIELSDAEIGSFEGRLYNRAYFRGWYGDPFKQPPFDVLMAYKEVLEDKVLWL
jgi:hypothetical protein